MNRLGATARVWTYNLENDHLEGHAFRLNFKCTNNMEEYEALVLGLQIVRKLGEKKSFHHGRLRTHYKTSQGRVHC